MKKSHGPALKKEKVVLTQCYECRGKSVIKGVFYELPCGRCNASGWVSAVTGEALPVEELVTQLSLRLQEAERHIEQLKALQGVGPGAQYEQNNRRGAGGTNYTGD
ncbi:hypothetical protein G7009_01485 [Pseudomonas capeferrum]|uniref:hypothetical protein n=1 Tax=Pseudomonas capeferrum TaxID=1495066 RepID=UPI0015E416DA|nr:hypothetical protein [Pseudomonas capeferrum]MBA1200475.1 hypothetical protein [Pseudomonas capeferrum]